MKTLFEILPSNSDGTNATLILEVGNTLVSAVLRDEDSNSFSAIAVYQFVKDDSNNITEELEHLLKEKEIFNLPGKNVHVISAFPQSVLVPFSLAEKEHFGEMVDMIHGDLYSPKKVYADLINEEGIYNVYKMPDSVWDVITTHFADCKLSHLYTSILKNISKENDQMRLVFYPGKLIVLLVKDGTSQLINTFDYMVPEDVSYLLLNICTQFDLKDIPLEIGGFIEENSILYKEIYKYFSVINFANLPTDYNYPEEVNNFPSHYFSHHFETAL